MTAAGTVRAPWTPEQFTRICQWQATPWVHPLTCGNSCGHEALAVTTEGLECPRCHYTQAWVPAVVAEYEPPPDPREQFGLEPMTEREEAALNKFADIVREALTDADKQWLAEVMPDLGPAEQELVRRALAAR